MHNQLIGKKGEDIAVDYLVKEKKYRIIFRNYKLNRYGEIDIIAIDKDSLVFIEVKTKTSLRFGRPVESINYKKFKSLDTSIKTFLATDGKDYENYNMRLEAIGVYINKDKYQIDWYVL